MKTLRFHGAPAVGLALLTFASGCATSDDPREGGLFGYWQHGEKGYERRLEERRAVLAETQAAADAGEQERAALEAQRDAARQALREQEEQLAGLRGEIDALQSVCEGIRAETSVQEKSRGELEQQLASLKDELEKVRAAPPPEEAVEQLRERQRRLAELQRELNLLRERASLLTTL